VNKAPRLVTVPVILDPSLEGAVRSAESRLNDRAQQLLDSFHKRADRHAAVTGLGPEEAAQAITEQDEAELNGLRAVYEDASKALNDAVQAYSFRPLGWKAWRALKAAHPTKEKDRLFDVDSLIPELLHLASHEPKLSRGAVDDLLESPDWSEGEITLLVNGALAAQS
jgi:hypothetical protein